MVKEKISIFSNFKFKLFLVIAIVIITSISITFGFFYAGHSQTGTSGINTLSCFDTTFSDGDSINLTKALSMSDDTGLKTEPYTFTITNNCDTGTNYYVILNVKENSFSADYINYSLNNKTPKTLSSAEENTYFNIPEEYTKSYVLDKGTLAKGVPKTYDTRLWINASTTYEQVQGKTFEAQIKVVSVVKELDNILYPTFVSTLLSKANDASITDYNSGVKTEMYTFSHPEAEQTTGWSEEERTDYRYIGNTPNNYVTFNDETWRIIGVFTVENENGEKEQRIKLIRDDPVGSIMWSRSMLLSYRNDWTTSTLAQMLNENYINAGGTFEYIWSDGDGNENKTTMQGLNVAARNQISTAKWYLGGMDSVDLSTEDFYNSERGEKTCFTEGTCEDETRKSSILWDIGVMYLSDYLYTFGYGVDEICFASGSSCKTDSGANPNNSWLYDSSFSQWTITPSATDDRRTFSVGSDGKILGGHRVTYTYSVNPVIYLRSNIEITGGDGSSGNPYQLKAVE